MSAEIINCRSADQLNAEIKDMIRPMVPPTAIEDFEAADSKKSVQWLILKLRLADQAIAILNSDLPR